MGLEPTRVLPHRILSPARLPFRHFGSHRCSSTSKLREIGSDFQAVTAANDPLLAQGPGLFTEATSEVESPPIVLRDRDHERLRRRGGERDLALPQHEGLISERR